MALIHLNGNEVNRFAAMLKWQEKCKNELALALYEERYDDLPKLVDRERGTECFVNGIRFGLRMAYGEAGREQVERAALEVVELTKGAAV